MLHKMFLHFKDFHIEEEYRESQAKWIRDEFAVFTSQFILMGVILLIAVISEDNYYYAILGCFGLILVVCFRYVIVYRPNLANFIYPLFQVVVALMFGVQDTILGFEFFQEYQWYFGFLSGILHLGLYYQGTTLCYQSWTLIGIFCWYISKFGFDSKISLLMSLQLIFLLVTLIFLRRTEERNRRIKFLEFRENTKWFRIVDKIVKRQIILISFDKECDQIRLVKSSRSFAEKHDIKNQKEFRSFIRSINIIDNKKNLDQKLEQFIRDMLQMKQDESTFKSNLTDELFYTFYGLSDSHHFKMKLMNYFQADTRLVILILKTIDFQNPKSEQIQNTIYNYISVLSTQSVYLLKSLKKPKMGRIFNQLYCQFLWFNTDIISKQNMQYVQLLNMYELLSKILKIDKIDIHYEYDSIYTSYSALILIITNLKNIIQFQNWEIRNCRIKQVQKHDLQYLKIYIGTNGSEMNDALRTYLIKHIFFYGLNSHQTSIKQQKMFNFAKISQNITQLHTIIDGKCNSKNQLCLNIVINKFLLLYYGLTNKISYKQKTLSFTLMDFRFLQF